MRRWWRTGRGNRSCRTFDGDALCSTNTNTPAQRLAIVFVFNRLIVLAFGDHKRHDRNGPGNGFFDLSLSARRHRACDDSEETTPLI